MKIYAGIGSRVASIDICNTIFNIGKYMAESGWLLRSGGSDKCDSSFESGCDLAGGKKEIFLPWKGFNNSTSQLYKLTDEAYIKASKIHPAWDKCSLGAKKMHTRNVYQILGFDLHSPVDLVICWTPNGKEIGGTATALKLAKEYEIKIINLANFCTENLDLSELIK